MSRFEVPVSISSEVIDGAPVFTEVGAHCVDSEWLLRKGPSPMAETPRTAECEDGQFLLFRLDREA